MRNGERGFTLIELMTVVIVVGVLAAIALANYKSMQDQARVGQVKSTMHIVQLATEEFATRNNGIYPSGPAQLAAEGAMTLSGLLPGSAMPENPFTNAATTLDWSNVAGTLPATDPAGGICLNVPPSASGTFDRYEILGMNGQNLQLALVLSNH
ncbi:MAG: prepilin-type N-terminal cleavage/methylation domain-containing protein [Gemmatimonadetes bacterium]|nr:prepilin-type N-terminal cleavage/methylation domain-containing protein [Gemmatimonadota bacterium]